MILTFAIWNERNWKNEFRFVFKLFQDTGTLHLKRLKEKSQRYFIQSLEFHWCCSVCQISEISWRVHSGELNFHFSSENFSCGFFIAILFFIRFDWNYSTGLFTGEFVVSFARAIKRRTESGSRVKWCVENYYGNSSSLCKTEIRGFHLIFYTISTIQILFNEFNFQNALQKFDSSFDENFPALGRLRIWSTLWHWHESCLFWNGLQV